VYTCGGLLEDDELLDEDRDSKDGVGVISAVDVTSVVGVANMIPESEACVVLAIVQPCRDIRVT
jgi:hypothetical protein